MNIQHSSRTDAWGTPRDVLSLVHDVLGEIDLDPASDEFFNQHVKAKRYLTAHDNALVSPWPTRLGGTVVYCNPPGGKTKNRSNTALFWDRLMQYKAEDHLMDGIFMAFSLEALQTTQASDYSILDFPLCVPRRRIAFVTPEGKTGPAPSHSNAIVYVPGRIDRSHSFREVFSVLGAVR